MQDTWHNIIDLILIIADIPLPLIVYKVCNYIHLTYN